jgi:Flp pilus assembly protein TadD
MHPKLSILLFLPCLLLENPMVCAAPFIPASDAEVLEQLPFKASDPATRELRRLREELTDNPRNLDKAVALAQRYYRLAMADGDPRYIGYAQAALSPWWEMAEAPVAVLVQRAALRQYSHNFSSALTDLELSTRLEPRNGTAWALLAAIHTVQAEYATARQDCEKLRGLASSLIVVACVATVDSLSGQAGQAYSTLQKAYASALATPDDEKLWVLTRLAEMSDRLGLSMKADAYFRAALKLNISDAYLLAVYAEFLLDEHRHSEVIKLLKDKERSDVLLMRLALAEKAINAPKAAEHQAIIRARFDAARMRADKLHIQDEARFNLYLLNNPKEALRLAQENWLGQHEPSDARILLETALAAKDKAAARPALDWFAQSHIEDRHLEKLVKAVRELK